MNVNEIDSKALAYVGDAIYELYIREYIVNSSREQVSKMHRKTVKYVSAKAQAKIIENIMEELTEKEIDIFKRGRNAVANTIPKNTDVVTYKIATGFESLVGYLYMAKENDRLQYLINKSIEIIERD